MTMEKVRDCKFIPSIIQNNLDVVPKKEQDTEFHKAVCLQKETDFQNIVPKRELDPDFHKDVIPKMDLAAGSYKLVKKEICNDKQNQDVDCSCLVHTKTNQEKGYSTKQEPNSNLTLFTGCFFSNVSKSIADYQLAGCQEKIALPSVEDQVKALNHQEEKNKITSSKLDTGNVFFKCDICNSIFYDVSYTGEHKESSGVKTYHCYSCNTAFAKSQNLTFQESQHSGCKQFKCDICSAAFASSYELTLHNRRHTGDKPYKCDICSTAFVQCGHLTVHKRKHTGERPYKCDICSSVFASRSELTKHKRIHTGEKPYKCVICSATFAQSSHLLRHKRKHTGERPYKCDNCSAAFASSSQLTIHKRKHT